jgi:uncharacterized protein YdcH (DUF465 family)
VSIIRDIRDLKKDDTHLARLFDKVQEDAELYLLAKQRQKGCDGMGEVATLKDEFIYSLNGIVRYCKEKGYFSGDVPYNIDLIARDICEMQSE